MTAQRSGTTAQLEVPASLAEIIPGHARRTPDRVLVSRRTGAGWEPVTAASLDEQVTALALGFLAAGVAPDDRVALMAKTRYEWTLVDAALWAVGAVTVPVYETSSADQLRWILEDSGAVGAVIENRGHVVMLDGVSADLPGLRHHWAIDEVENRPTLQTLEAAGREHDGPEARAELDRRRGALTHESLATVIYTSGTTGRPKGCALTHGNFLAEVTSAIEMLPELFEDEDGATLLFLPLAHVFGRMLQIAVLHKGVHLGHSDVARITRDLPTFRPTFVLAVPRVFERVYDGARRKAAAAGRGRVFDLATATAIAYSEALEGPGRGGPGVLLRLRRALFDRLVYGKIRAAFGGRTRWAISGGAALGPRLGHFFRGVGVTVLEGYGLTETTAAATVNTRAATRIGTVGRALPRFEIGIADDGEVLVRGGHVFHGYWHDASATDAVLDADGWFHTGDLGSLDVDGFLTITGRAKEILVTSSGKNVAPGPLEDVLRAHPLVSQAIVIGDGRASVAALVTLDAEAVADWLSRAKRPAVPVAELVADPDLLGELRQAVAAANATVSSAEAIKHIRVLPVDLTEESGHLTPTLKLKRAVVMSDFAADVEAVYRRKVGS
jgi:long-chain acyl-CoA synthetase